MTIFAQGVSKTYGSTKVLDNVSFRIETPTSFMIIGPNAAGKSTLIKCMVGLSRFEGKINILGLDPSRTPLLLNKILGYSPQRPEFPKHVKVKDILALICRLKGRPEEDVKKVAEKMEITEHLDKRFGELSGGFKERVSIAQSLIGEPSLVVLDEPFESLDLRGTGILKKLIKDLLGEGKTIIVATHMIGEVEDLMEKALLLEHGKTIAFGDAEEVVRKYRSHLWKGKR